jgi:hypothetical protein
LNIDKPLIQISRNKGIEIKIENPKSLIQVVKKEGEKCVSIEAK